MASRRMFVAIFFATAPGFFGFGANWGVVATALAIAKSPITSWRRGALAAQAPGSTALPGRGGSVVVLDAPPQQGKEDGDDQEQEEALGCRVAVVGELAHGQIGEAADDLSGAAGAARRQRNYGVK